ncbi:MAG: DUF5682 family protein [Oscillospiraceae bacterium]
MWNLFSSPRHREASRFFHRTVFLGCGFAQRVKGPDLLRGTDRNLIRETWKYKWTGQVAAALIDRSVSGATVEEACRTELRRRLGHVSLAGKGAALLVQGFEMGLTDETNELAGALEPLIAADGDFFSLAQACRSLHTLWELRELYREREEQLPRLLDGCFCKLAQLPPSPRSGRIGSAPVSRSAPCCNRLSAGEPFAARRPILLGALEQLAEAPDANPGLHGAALGLLYGADAGWKSEVLRVGAGYLRGTRENASFRRFPARLVFHLAGSRADRRRVCRDA